MAVILFDARACIHEVPKCASVYIVELLKHNNIPFLQTHIPRVVNPKCEGIQAELLSDYSSNCTPNDSRVYKMTERRLCFVRHPLTWYLSYFRFKEMNIKGPQGKGNHIFRSWRYDSNFDKLCCSHNFNDFVDQIIGNYPDGFLWPFFYSYIRESTEVGRVEDLQPVLTVFIAQILHLVIDFGLPRQNVSVGNGEHYTRAQADKIMELEHDLVKHFDYSHKPGGAV